MPSFAVTLATVYATVLWSRFPSEVVIYDSGFSMIIMRTMAKDLELYLYSLYIISLDGMGISLVGL